MRSVQSNLAAWLAAIACSYVLGGLAAPSTLCAQEDARARQHYTAGESYFSEGDYEGARREFLQAYRLSPRPQLLYNLYLTEERGGRYADAAAHLAQYLAEEPELPNRAQLEVRLAHLRARVAADAAADASGGTDTGTHSGPDTGTGTGTHSGASTGTDTGADTGTDAGRAAERGESGLVTGAIVSLAVAGAAAIVFAVGGGLALAENDRLAGTCGERTTSSCEDAALSDLRSYTLLADVGLGVAVVGAALGGLLLGLGLAEGPANEGAVAITPWVGVGGGGASVRGRL